MPLETDTSGKPVITGGSIRLLELVELPGRAIQKADDGSGTYPADSKRISSQEAIGKSGCAVRAWNSLSDEYLANRSACW
jgi:hypothetical protein